MRLAFIQHDVILTSASGIAPHWAVNSLGCVPPGGDLKSGAANVQQSTRLQRAIGHFEIRLLAEIVRLGDDAWASRLRSSISENLGRDVVLAQLYLALSKLQKRGLISFRQLPSEPRQGGRSKKVFFIEAPGREALSDAAAAIDTGAHPRVSHHDRRERTETSEALPLPSLG